MADEKRDLFGRTEAEIVTAIDWKERVYKVSSGYSGGESLALELARKRANLDVDRRCLAELRGERVKHDEPIRHFTPAQLEQWRKDLVRRSPARNQQGGRK